MFFTTTTKNLRSLLRVPKVSKNVFFSFKIQYNIYFKNKDLSVSVFNRQMPPNLVHNMEKAPPVKFYFVTQHTCLVALRPLAADTSCPCISGCAPTVFGRVCRSI